MDTIALKQIKGMEKSRHSIVLERIGLAIGSKDEKIATNSIASLTEMIAFHRKRLRL